MARFSLNKRPLCKRVRPGESAISLVTTYRASKLEESNQSCGDNPNHHCDGDRGAPSLADDVGWSWELARIESRAPWLGTAAARQTAQ